MAKKIKYTEIARCKECGKYAPISAFKFSPVKKKMSPCKICRSKRQKEINKKQFGTPEGRYKQSVRSMTYYLIAINEIELKGVCEECGKSIDIQIHHIEPYDSRNIAELCRKPCHSAKHPRSKNKDNECH
jgi:hypothetical protein